MNGTKIDIKNSIGESNSENDCLSEESINEKDEKQKSESKIYYWASPEVLEENHHTNKSDIWSVGTLALEMLQGFPCYSNLVLTDDEIIDSIIKGGILKEIFC